LKRLASAPNLAIATLWSDLLTQEGFECTEQRRFASSIAGQIPPDQALPEVWLVDETRFEAARTRLDELRQPMRERRWVCRQCQELVEGPFEQCWNCGAMAP
jgi:hypothetical protein